MKRTNRSVIPGFGLTTGITLTILSVVVLIPLASLVVFSAQMSFDEIVATITRDRVLSSFRVSFVTAFVASLINAVMGVVLAWVLVKYSFIALTALTADTGLVGGFFAKFGIKIAFTQVGITVALVFIGIPFVVRAVQPVLEKLDPAYEEAAGVLGASRSRIFWKIVIPEIIPAALTGFGLAFGRCLGEYGSVVFIAGNKPFETEIVPLIIMSELQEYDYASATTIALVMLVASFVTLFLVNLIQTRNTKILKGGI